MFSGAPPSVTGVPANEWLNRKAIMGTDPGAVDQCLGCDDAHLGPWVATGGGAYNRHFQNPFVYDVLRAESFRSIVIKQQAGLGEGNSDASVAGDWDPFGIFDVSLASGYDQAKKFDKHAADAAIGRVAKEGDSFDLMVVYLAGLDHYLHDYSITGATNQNKTGIDGVVLPTGETEAQWYFRDTVHAQINSVVTRLEQAFGETTVYGVFGDHGLVDTDRDSFMKFSEVGPVLRRNGFDPSAGHSPKRSL